MGGCRLVKGKMVWGDTMASSGVERSGKDDIHVNTQIIGCSSL